MRLGVSILLFNIVLGAWILYKHFLYWLNEDYCREHCFPYSFDMMDEETCACWRDDGTIEVKEVEYE